MHCTIAVITNVALCIYIILDKLLECTTWVAWHLMDWILCSVPLPPRKNKGLNDVTTELQGGGVLRVESGEKTMYGSVRWTRRVKVNRCGKSHLEPARKGVDSSVFVRAGGQNGSSRTQSLNR